MTAPLRIPYPDAPDPLTALERVAHLAHPVLLDGAADRAGLGRWSYLAVEPVALLVGSAEQWPAARDRIRATFGEMPPAAQDEPPFQGGWVGWLGYELGRAFDRQPTAGVDRLGTPDFSLGRYPTVIAWDHQSARAWIVGPNEAACRRLQELVRGDPAPGRRVPDHPADHPSQVTTPVRSDFTSDGYRRAVGSVIDHVLAGDIFQANLSQRFTVSFTGDPVAAYRALRSRAPGSHAAYLDRGRIQVLSMSPELFLRFSPATRLIETRPIKGTRPRHADPGTDAALAAELVASAKDRAENVMIVDLVRNDLNRVAEHGSVTVPALCQLESFAAVHHLVSTVQATLQRDRDALDLVAATFPAGSITGAPKLRAMAILAGLERERRGVYCGAIGWIGTDGALELNVAIRTVTIAHGIATVPAGGGVTALSDPVEEHRETLDKARALLAALEDAR